MASLKERLKDNEYKLWIKDGLCLGITKKGLEKFADERSLKTYTFVKSAVEKQAVVTTSDGDIIATNKICDNAKVVSDRQSGWSLGCCKKDCDIYVKEIVKLCKQAPGKSRFKLELTNWGNSEVQLWPSEPWEIAKVYMNKGQKAFQKNAKDTDLSGLLNFIDHCSIPWVDIHNKDNIAKVRDARNSTMHSASMKVTNNEFLAHTDAMIALLQDPLFMDKIQEAKDAATEIQKIVQGDIIISSTDELKVLTDKTSSLQDQNDRLQEEVNTLKMKYTELETSGDQRDKTLSIIVKAEAGQRGDIEILKTEIVEKEKRMKELSTELTLVKKLIDQDKDLYRKMDIRVKHVETTLGKTATEFREIKQSHYSLVEEVQRIRDGMQLSGFDSKNMDLRKADIDNLKEENDSLKLRLKEYVKEIEELHIKNKELEHISTITKSKGEIQDNTKLLAAEKANKVLGVKNENLTEEIEQLKNELRKSNQNDTGTECKNRACRSRIEALEYDVEKLSSKKNLAEAYHALEDRNIALEAQLTFSTNETEKMNTLIEELRNELHTAQHKIQELNAIITGTVSEKIAQQENHMGEKSDLENKIKGLKQDNLSMLTEVGDRHNQIQNLVRENENLNADMKRIKSENVEQSQTHTAEKASFKNQLELFHSDKTRMEIELNEWIQNLILENENLKRDLQSSSQGSYEYGSEAESKIENLNAEKAILQNKLSRKEEECELFKKENTRMKTELNERIQNLILENETLKRDLQSNSQGSYEYRSKAESKIDSLTAEKVALQNELSRKEEECELFKKENTSLKTTEIKQNATKDIDAILALSINVRLPSDAATPWISGAQFMSSGDLVVCDGKNKKITVLDKSFHVKGSVASQSQPWDVSEIDSNTVVVSVPYEKQIKVIEMQPFPHERQTYHVDRMCWGIHVFKGEIYVTHLNRLGEGGAVILDLEGKLKKRIEVYGLEGSIVFINPENIAVNKFGLAAVAVSDNDSNSVTIMDEDRTLYCQYTDSGLISPGGLCFDKRSNVIVCGSGSNNLQIISLFGEKLKTIVTPQNPITVAYREDDTIVVGFGTDFLLLIDLKRFFKD